MGPNEIHFTEDSFHSGEREIDSESNQGYVASSVIIDICVCGQMTVAMLISSSE